MTTVNYGDADVTGTADITGTSSGDVIVSNDDTYIKSGNGDDTVTTGAGDDTVRSGSGDDTVSTGAGDDTIKAGSGDDLVLAGSGDDLVLAGSGDDIISAGAGNDSINAGSGDDVVSGGLGDDLIYAGSGHDTVLGGDGDDTINAQQGDDCVHGGDGNDVINGWSGHDTVTGDAGNDVLIGHSGNDLLMGGEGCDTIYGGSNNDVLAGGSGVDVLYGGSSNDTFIGGSGDSVNYFVGGNGWDKVVYSGDRSEYTISVVGGNCWGGRIYKIEHISGSIDILYSIESVKFNQDTAALMQGCDAPIIDALRPDAVDDVFTVTEDGGLAGNVLANDDGLGEEIIITAIAIDGQIVAPGESFEAATAGGLTVTVTVDANGDVTVSGDGVQALAAGETDTVTFQTETSSELGGSDASTTTITLVGENDDSVANQDDLAGGEDDVISGNVLTNDEDIDGDVLTVSAVGGAAANVGVPVNVTSDLNGFAAEVVIEADGSVTVTPGDDFDALPGGATDTVTVSYTVSDGAGGESTSTVVVTVTGENDGPTVVADDAEFTVDEDAAGVGPVTGNILTNDEDAEGDALSISSVNGDPAAVGTVVNVTSDANGFDATVEIDAAGNVTVTPSAAFADLNDGESDTITVAYEVSDGNGGTTPANLTVTVNGFGAPQADVSYNIVFVVDTSAAAVGSVISGQPGGVFDGADPSDLNLNGDANSGSILDAEILALREIVDELEIDNAGDDVDIGIVTTDLDLSSGLPGTGATLIANGLGETSFGLDEDVVGLLQGSGGVGPAVFNSSIGAANDFFASATLDDTGAGSVNLVYFLGTGLGIDNDFVVADANLATELGQLDANFGAEVDTLIFDANQAGSAQVAQLETLGDGVVNVIDTAQGLQDFVDTLVV